MKILRYILLGIPNIPLIILITSYVYYNLIKHNGLTEMQITMMNEEEFITDEIKRHLSKMFPKAIFFITAFWFWGFLTIKLINKF